MEFLSNFITTYIFYIQELWLAILIGFLLSGFLYQFISTDIVEKFLGKKGLKPLLIASCIGVILPVCCFGSLPIAMTLQRKGAKLGPVLAFLVATPATSVSALIVCLKLLGLSFTVYIFCVVVIMGLVIGVIGNMIHSEFTPKEQPAEDCCHHESCSEDHQHSRRKAKIKGIFRYAFITLPKEIGLELLLGVAIASFIMVFPPLQNAINQYLTGIMGYILVLIGGLATYVCSTASVPMADALIQSGMGYGQAMTYLLVGPITSYATLLVLRKEFGIKVFSVYLLVISILSVLFGVGFELLKPLLK